MKKPLCAIVGVLLVCCLLAACQAEDDVQSAPTPDPETYENLIEAMEAEANSAAQYTAYAQVAEEEGRAAIANVFRAIADANQLHSDKHFEVATKMGQPEAPIVEDIAVDTTIKNLERAYTIKTDEFRKMYPPLLSQAEKVKQEEALAVFNYAMRADMAHAELLYDLYEFVEDIDRPEYEEIYLCPVCGNIVTKLPGSCVVCHSPGEDFATYTAT